MKEKKLLKLLYIPLDERPCNLNFPQKIASIRNDVELIAPSKKLLGDKRKPAVVNKLWDFVNEKIVEADAAILSLDMLVYGGLIPSRLHKLTIEEAEESLNKIEKLKSLNRKIKIYAFSCIMRAPQYNSSEEEPDYYEEYGFRLFRRKYLLDKRDRTGITPGEEEEINSINIPLEILQDYEERRLFNEEINLKVVELVEKGIIDFLVIPQDDSSEFGYTAISQKRVISYVKEKKLEMQVNIYPGADEVGSTLMARAFNDYHNRTLKVYPFFSSTLGPQIVPLYEDRPMAESLKYHVRAMGGEIVDTIDEAEVALAINSPGKVMEESPNQDKGVDLTYSSHRNLFDFVMRIKSYIEGGHRVALCDSAFANGGDLELIDYLDRLDLIDKLSAYAGWNTNCNTLGTVLSTSALCTPIINIEEINKYKLVENLIYRIVEDSFYQARVRGRITEEFLPKEGISYYAFAGKQMLVEEAIKEKLINEYNKLKMSSLYPVIIEKVSMPWRRMFEIGMDLRIIIKC
ncbi:DUF4127 family protein [Alloiococcus sp. CFN-8]|uniref:DUF4127 family protein n=1 Tax=Alloiococcus sp. CFN-8 TaxID=3416081 RepID=UPI003CFB1097